MWYQICRAPKSFMLQLSSLGKEYFELSGCTSIYVPLCSRMQAQGLGKHPGAHQLPPVTRPFSLELGNTLTIRAGQEILLSLPTKSTDYSLPKTSHASAGPPGMTREAIHSTHTNNF